MPIPQTGLRLYYVMTLLLLLVTANVACATDKVVLQLKWRHQFQFAGFYAAQSQGYFAKEGLDVDIREVDVNRSASDIVLSGDAQFGISDSGLVLSRLQGKPIVAIAAVFQHSPLVLITLESSNILSPLELKNKRVMFQKSIDDAVIISMFQVMGLAEEEYVHEPYSFKEDALISGDVDAISAYITDQPYFYQNRNIPINIISPANYGIDFYGDMIFVEQQYLENNKEQVLAFRRASIRGWKYAIEHPQQIISWMLANLTLSKSREQLTYEAQGTIRLIGSQLVELGHFSTKRLERIANIYRELGLVPEDAEFSGINYQEYYSAKTIDRRWLQIAAFSLLAVFSLLPILGLINRKLKQQVALRTNELEKANHSMARYLQVIDNFTITCSTSTDNRITSVSTALCVLSGYSEQEILGNTPAMFAHPDVSDDTLISLKQALASKQCWSGEILQRDKLGHGFWLYCEIEPLVDEHNCYVGFASVSIDITDKKKIETLSLTDSLTGLANRRHLDSVFNKEIASARRNNKEIAIIMIDIDHFKRVNDQHGHIVGDEVLKGFAYLLKTHTRGEDTAGRWGGEEFLLIFPDTDLAGAQRIAQLLQQSIAQYKFADTLTQSCSFGIAQWDGVESLRGLLGRADEALYQAKENGRNRIELALP